MVAIATFRFNFTLSRFSCERGVLSTPSCRKNGLANYATWCKEKVICHPFIIACRNGIMDIHTHIQFTYSLGKEFGKPLIYIQHCRNGNWICTQFSVNRKMQPRARSRLQWQKLKGVLN